MIPADDIGAFAWIIGDIEKEQRGTETEFLIWRVSRDRLDGSSWESGREREGESGYGEKSRGTGMQMNLSLALSVSEWIYPPTSLFLRGFWALFSVTNIIVSNNVIALNAFSISFPSFFISSISLSPSLFPWCSFSLPCNIYRYLSFSLFVPAPLTQPPLADVLGSLGQ